MEKFTSKSVWDSHPPHHCCGACGWLRIRVPGGVIRCFRCVIRVKAAGLSDVWFDECLYGRAGVICGARDVKVNKGGEETSPAVGFESPPHFFVWGVVWGCFRGFLGVWRCFRCCFGTV